MRPHGYRHRREMPFVAVPALLTTRGFYGSQRYRGVDMVPTKPSPRGRKRSGAYVRRLVSYRYWQERL